jgi:hypothetical protein
MKRCSAFLAYKCKSKLDQDSISSQPEWLSRKQKSTKIDKDVGEWFQKREEKPCLWECKSAFHCGNQYGDSSKILK